MRSTPWRVATTACVVMLVVVLAMALVRSNSSSPPTVSTRRAPTPVVLVSTGIDYQALADGLAFQHQVEVDNYLAALQRVADEAARVAAEQAAEAAAAAEEAAARARVQSVVVAQPVVAPTATTFSLAPCGGDLPPCYVAARESGGNYGAFNPTGCGGTGCYGKWQFGGFWAGKLGLPIDIWNATPEQQDNAARVLWNGGAGCSNWAAC